MQVFEKGSGAAFSSDRRYRYALWRNWRGAGKRVLFIGLNPSTADQQHNDPTIRRCIGFAKNWGFDGLMVGNLFAFRASQPDELRKARRPIGPANLKWLVKLAGGAELLVACWGNNGNLLGQDRAILNMFDRLHCLKVNSTGSPAHPLYLPRSLTPIPYQATACRSALAREM